MARSSLRFGVVGLGFGAGVHVPGLRSIPGIEVAALAGATYEKARSVADALGIPEAAGGYEALGGLGLDAVTLALPPKHAGDAAAYFLGRGIPVLCEKPLAMNAAAAARLADAARVPCAVDFQFPELDAFRASKRVLDEGTLGAVRHIALTWMVESLANRSGPSTWKTSADEGGGVMSLLMSHAVYNAMWLQSPIARVFARVRTTPAARAGSNAAPDTVQFSSTLADGACFGGIVSNASPGAQVHRWEVVGERGCMVIENLSRDYMSGFSVRLQEPGRGVRTLHETKQAADVDGRIAPFASLATRFAAAIRDGRAMHPSFDDGLRVQLVLDAMQSSSRSGVDHEVEARPAA